ncbi:MAG TPA: ribonuclease H-like domain-containing protein [Vicinamibacterales bacterium]
MTTLAERLRGVVGPAQAGPHGSETPDDRGGRLSASAEASAGPRRSAEREGGQPAHVDAVAETLGGEWRDVRGHRYLVVNRTYAPGYRHGHVAVMDALPPWPRFHLIAGAEAAALHAAHPRPLLFLDLETTGLAGGAGTYAFLIGLAWFDGAVFRTRQFFLSNYTAERALLEGAAGDAASAGAVVTYNGKSFDLPLIETRFVLHRMATPFGALPHVDMLHPARRLWRPDEEAVPGGCCLTMLEETLCGHRRDGDVPAFEIPSRYFQYVHTGDARPLAGVFEHNRLDLLALALITAHASQLLDEGPTAAQTAREALGLGRLYERAGMTVQASGCYTRALELPGEVPVKADALRSYAVLSRRARRFQDAAAAWRRVLELRRCPPAIAREAMEALAVHHEHRARDLREARRFALQSLQFNITVSRQRAVQHRLARLNRRLGAPIAMPLF